MEKDNSYDNYINNATNPVNNQPVLFMEDNAYSDYTSENHLTKLDKDNKKELYDDVYSDYIMSSQEELEEQTPKQNIR